MADIIKDELLGEIECVDGFETEVNWVNNKKIDDSVCLPHYS